MNISKINELVNSCPLTKAQIAEKGDMSRTTLDNLLAGADVKVSTVESLASVLGVSVGSLFEDDKSNDINEEIVKIRRQLEDLVNVNKPSKVYTKVLVELELSSDEFIKLGLKDKVVQVLNKK